MELSILYSDNHLLVLNKPAGLMTQDSGTGKANLEDIAREYVRKEKNKPGNVFLHAAHRIDTPVSGAVLFARTGKALKRLHQSIKKGSWDKVYHGVVSGKPKKPSGKLIHYLRHSSRKAEITGPGDSRGKKAVLSYTTLKRAGHYTLLEIELETGRYHQIRAQFGAINCPVFGDRKYGSNDSIRRGIIALHHRKLVFPHPVRDEIIEITAPYPDYWPIKAEG